MVQGTMPLLMKAKEVEMPRDREVKILDEPLGGQQPGENGDYLVAEVAHRMRRGYMLHVRFLHRERREGEHYTTESYMLFTSARSALVVADPGPFSQKKLQAAAGTPAQEMLAVLKPQVGALYHADKAKRAREKQEYEARIAARTEAETRRIAEATQVEKGGQA